MKYILVADDEPLNQCIFEEVLCEEFELGVVEDGVACLESIEQRLPDLLLLDIAMPRMDGLEVCRRLRQDEKTRRLPIILVSAHAAPADRERGLAAGADDYLSKPFNIVTLYQRVQALLGEP